MLQLEETKRNKNESTNSILRHFIRTDFLYKTKYAQYLSYDVISKLLHIEIFRIGTVFFVLARLFQ